MFSFPLVVSIFTCLYLLSNDNHQITLLNSCSLDTSCDIQKDKKGRAPTMHWKSREEVLSFKEKFELADIWRIHNPDIMHLTWKRTNPEIQCRLDYFLISDSLCPNVFEAEILPGYRTDHCMITVRISATTNPRGPGFWKLNTHFLTKNKYIDLKTLCRPQCNARSLSKGIKT